MQISGWILKAISGILNKLITGETMQNCNGNGGFTHYFLVRPAAGSLTLFQVVSGRTGRLLQNSLPGIEPQTPGIVASELTPAMQN